jgi:hypothetical protein
MPSDQKQKHRGLVICETRSSTWNYHLRELTEEGTKYGGAHNTFALCGQEIGWDIRTSLNAWGRLVDHIPEHYCEKCFELAVKILPEVKFTLGSEDTKCSCRETYKDHPLAYLDYNRNGVLRRLCDGTIVKL